MCINQRVLAAIAAGGLCAAAAAQDCATVVLPEHVPVVEELRAAGAYELPEVPVGVQTIPVSVHVVRRTNGTGGISQFQVDQAFDDTNDRWSQAGIQFCQYGPLRFIDDDSFYNSLSALEADVLPTIDVVPNTLNLYFVPNYVFCGRGSFTFSVPQGVIVTNSCAGTSTNPSTMAHEFGHFLDLFHTHEDAFGLECTDGSNCASAGDQLCDTPADPVLSGLVASGCNYVGDIDGPCDGDPPYAPDPMNIMSYSLKSCRNDFSIGQRNKASATLNNLRPELLTFTCSLADSCGSGAGDCFVSNGTPGCNDSRCCAAVCAVDVFCCDISWDSICADEADEICLTGNDCSDPITVEEGVVSSVTLDDNTASGQSSSCAANDDVDEIYQYTAGCSGPATASICTEFTVVDIVISVFDNCNGTEIACSQDHDDCFFGGPNNAKVTWSATAGETYYIRVSGVDASPGNNFLGDLVISCAGCGSATAGDCFTANGSPYCEDALCCEAVCDADPFCCDNTWDSLCAGAAPATCNSCGGAGTGSCFSANGTPYCIGDTCCDTVCSADPFCCNTEWDSICADEARSLCGIDLDGIPHFPLGEAVLGVEGETLFVGNIGSTALDGVGMLLGLGGNGEGGVGTSPGVLAEIDLSPVAFAEGSYVEFGAVTTASTSGDDPYGSIGVLAVDLQNLLLGLFQGPGTYTAQLRSGGEIIDEVIGVEGQTAALTDSIVTPAAVKARTHAGELALHVQWSEPVLTELIGGSGAFLGDEVVLISETGDGPDDSPTGSLDTLLLEAADVGGEMAITGETFNFCPWDCGDGDGIVGIVDFLTLLSEWGQIGTACDIDGGGVGITEFLNLLANWGPCPTSP